MTRSNVYIKLTNGKKLFFVLDSTAPEQGFIVEKFILPLLALNDARKEMEWIETFSDSIGELRVNATYRYVIDLQEKTVQFFDEHYNYKTNKFRKGKDLTEERYLPYVRSLKNLEVR